MALSCRWQSRMEDTFMKEYSCYAPGCSWHTRAEEEAEVIRRASEHMRSAHGETHIRPSMVEQIKSRIKESEDADS